jgi:hypothetical protein
MTTSAATDVSRARALARPGEDGGDAPRPSPSAEAAVRPAPPLSPTAGGVRAKPNLQCVASHVFVSAACPPHCERQCGTFPPEPLPSDNGNGLCAVRRADHAAGPSAYAEERGLCMHCCASAWRGVAQARRRAVCGGCTSATAASYAASSSPSCASWRSVRLRRFGPIRCAARRRGCGTALPEDVRDGLVGAADEQRHGGFGAAAVRRPVQRCPPAGRRRRSRPPPTNRCRTGRRGRRTRRLG